MNHRSDEIIKQLNRLANDRNQATYTRNKLRDAISHVRALQLKLSELKRDPELVTNEHVERLDTLTSRQRNLIKKLEYENQHLKLKTRALTKRVRDLKEKSAEIDREPA
ncbi:MAG: hypothetical protein OES20_01475 [Gammaproteobacteria bacterium]|nr:hypothetical protein [Gammaproteobacteria bacterium]MDH3858712.1 hypothetical protein [Gammaproteobacteria bacterium]